MFELLEFKKQFDLSQPSFKIIFRHSDYNLLKNIAKKVEIFIKYFESNVELVVCSATRL